MRADALSVSEVLDGAAEVVARIFSPWVGVLWLTALPVRLLQVHFAARLGELGSEARLYGNHLHGIALAATAAFVVSLLGRAVFARACVLGLRTTRAPGTEALRLPVAVLANYVYAALLIEVGFFATAISFVAMPVMVLLAGLAAATSTLPAAAGPLAPLRQIARHGTQAKVLVALTIVFAIAVVLALANLFVFRFGLWLLGGVPTLSLTAWQGRLDFGNPGFVLVLAAGASLIVEPYWLAALVVYVHKVRARESGEDLRVWFERLRSAAPP